MDNTASGWLCGTPSSHSAHPPSTSCAQPGPLEGQREAPCTEGSGLRGGAGRGFLKERAGPRVLGLSGVGVCACICVCTHMCVPCDLAVLAFECIYVGVV